MSELKHTPGPWRIDPILINVKDGGTCPAYIRNQNNVIIADMNFNIPAGIGSQACTANAKLIAASPDMFTELKDNHEFLLQMYSAFDTPKGLDFKAIQQSLRDKMAKQLKIIEKATT